MAWDAFGFCCVLRAFQCYGARFSSNSLGISFLLSGMRRHFEGELTSSLDHSLLQRFLNFGVEAYLAIVLGGLCCNPLRRIAVIALGGAGCNRALRFPINGGLRHDLSSQSWYFFKLSRTRS